MSRLAIICGTGPSKNIELQLEGLVKRDDAKNQYGDVSNYSLGEFKGQEVLIMQRHGKGKKFLTPAGLSKERRYEANILELYNRGVKDILSFSCVGIGNPQIRLVNDGIFVVASSYKRGPGSTMHSFYDLEGLSPEKLHVPMGNSFDVPLTTLVACEIANLGNVVVNGLYDVTGGDIFETPEEIRGEIKLHELTGDTRELVFGMTAPYELMLARQLGMNVATVALPTNYAEGVKDAFDHNSVVEHAMEAKQMVTNIIEAFIKEYSNIA